MSLSRMRSLFAPHLQLIRESIFFDNHLAVLHGDATMFRIVMQQSPPFSINDHRLGIVLRGSICASINLVEKRITAGTLVFLGPGSIITPLSISPDAEVFGFALAPDFAMPFAEGQLPPAFNGQVRDFQLPAEEADAALALQILETLWRAVRQPRYDRAVVASLVAAQMQHYNTLFLRFAQIREQGLTRAQTVFDRFIALINRHAVRERHMSFYASRLCLSERYLGTVVRQASGITAKEWIDRAVITQAKILLRHSELSVLEISEELGFPNPSFFSKYFRRLTGLTPLGFKTSRGI